MVYNIPINYLFAIKVTVALNKINSKILLKILLPIKIDIFIWIRLGKFRLNIAEIKPLN